MAPTSPFRTLRCFLEVCLVLFVPSANCRLDKKAAKRLGGNQRKSQSNKHFLTTELVTALKIFCRKNDALGPPQKHETHGATG